MHEPAPLNGLDLLRIIDEAVAGESGAGFFRSLVVGLAKSLQVANAFASEFTPDFRQGIVAAEWLNGALLEGVGPFEIAGTPCQRVIAGDIVAIERDVAKTYPYLRELNAESYLAIPLKREGGLVLGHLAVMDTKPRAWQHADFGILRIFASRAAVEIERRHFERELVEARRAAETANQAKTQFLAHMSHEVRTPLNAIFGYAQLMGRNPQLTEEQSNALLQITHAGEHLLELMNDLLDIAKIEAGRVELDLEPCNLQQCIENVLGVARLRAAQAGITLDFVPPSDWPPDLLLDERKLRQIVLNVLNNAVKFTPRGSAELTLDVIPQEAGTYRLCLGIRDTGVGIAPEALPYIFEPFYRANHGGRRIEGSGLGLAIVQRLVDLMKGAIRVDSIVGIGTTFNIELPVTAATRAATTTLKPSARIVGHTGRARTILIADDVQASRTVLKQLLFALGFHVLEATNGVAAMTLANADRPDLIFMDLVMPELDGFEAARRLRADANTERIPIVALSASAFEDTATLSSISGCNAFLTKPLHFDEIIDTLEKQLAIEWIYAPVANPTPSADLPTRSSAHATPSAQALAELLRFAQHGDVRGITTLLDSLHTDTDSVFMTTLRGSVNRYDMQAIRDYLGPLVR